MKNLLIALCLIFILGCTNDDQPNPTGDITSKLVGDYIYHVVGGYNQSGVFGAYLDEIKIVVTDLEGRNVYRNLSFQLSDESGSLRTHFTNAADTLVLNWKMGCNDDNQHITVTDNNVCGLVKNDCIEVEVFEISATASQSQTSGWVSPCLPSYYQNYSDIFSANDHIFMIHADGVYSTNDPAGLSWNTSSPVTDLQYRNKNITNSGVLYYQSGNAISILNESGKSWTVINNPFYNTYYDVVLVASEEGEYYLGSSYSELIFHSKDLRNWSQFIDLSEVLNDSYYTVSPEAMVADNENLYILADSDNVISVNLSSGIRSVFEINGQWSYQRLGSMQIYAQDGVIIFEDNNYIKKIDAASGTLTTLLSNIYSQFLVSGNTLYLNKHYDELLKWTGSSFINQTYDYPIEDYAIIVGIYNEYPLLWDYNQNQLLLYATTN